MRLHISCFIGTKNRGDFSHSYYVKTMLTFFTKILLRLILVDIYSGKKQTLLGGISFVQWVPQSDVVVGQSNNNLAIWYNIDLPEHVTLTAIRGDAIEVVREGVCI